MNAFTLHKQRGAVLAFSLVMLLLLTLVSTSMIQQNKVQIGVATNAGQRVQAFASVETALRATQATLEPLRYQNKATRTCRSGTTNSLHPIPHASGTLNLNDNTITAQIVAEYCISDYADGQGNEHRCFYSSSGVRNMIAGTPATNTSDNVTACQRLTDAGSPSGCQIEVYTLNVTLAETNGAKRTVESKFEIDCSGDL